MAIVRVFLLFVGIFQFNQVLWPSAPLAAEGKVLVFGRIHDDPVRSIRDRQEFVDYIGSKLAPFGIAGAKIMVVEKIQLLAQALREGKVDLFHDSVGPAMILSKWAGSVPILRQWKFGASDYEGVIVVKKASGINTLADLKGKVVAFEEPHSTSAGILPRMLLEEQKLKLFPVKAPGAVKPDVVGVMYGADGSSVNVLMTGKSDAAATLEREIDRLKPEIRESLKIIGRTISVPRQILAVRKDLDPKMVKELKSLLTKMDTYPEGQEVLKRQQNTNRFDELPTASIEQMKRVEKYIFSSLGKEVDSW